jgi:AmmeMemoRadiSam system protein B/AmmeMemoRadiSam system protein A
MQKVRTYSRLPDREAAVAGKFYPANERELLQELEVLFAQANKLTENRIKNTHLIRSIIVPHAGYVFSGLIAASAFTQIKNHQYDRIFIIGSSHHTWFEGASIYYEGHFITPLGKVEIDSVVAKELMAFESVVTYNEKAHKDEHSLEVQLPFLQYIMPQKFKIIPIIIGSQSKIIPFKLSELLRPYFTPENLFIISTDLSHYPKYNDAVKIDTLTVEAICKNDPDKFIAQINENEKKRIEGLATSICGWSSVLCLINLTTKEIDINYSPLLYQNSGDITLYGEKSRVVGYQSIIITSESKDKLIRISLSDSEKKTLLDHARDSITRNIYSKTGISDPDISLPVALLSKYGAFVSIYVDEQLRGCIGRLESDEPIYRTIEKMAVASSLHDSRFNPIGQDELNSLHIEISIISPLHKIASIDEIIPGKHGIFIRKDYRSGTFLPQVAIKTGWDVYKLLSECSLKKAGLGTNGWKDADIYIYEAEVFSD